MARPHIEFIHTQQLPWQDNLLPSLPGVQGKMLSEDDETGACSVLLRYPSGWRQDGALHFTVGEEFYVLYGALTINGQDYGLDCFAYLPAGHVRANAVSKDGCDVITFFDAARSAVAGEPEPGTYDTGDAILHLNAHDMPWTAEGMDPYYGDNGMQWKMLHYDPETNAATILVTVPPQWHPENWRGPQEIHDCMEEAFILAGDLHTHNVSQRHVFLPAAAHSSRSIRDPLWQSHARTGGRCAGEQLDGRGNARHSLSRAQTLFAR